MRARSFAFALASLLSLSEIARAQEEPVDPSAPQKTSPKAGDAPPAEDAGPSPDTVPEKEPPKAVHRRRVIPDADAAEPSVRHIAITWLPLELLLPMGALSAEVRLSDETSFAVFGGYGTAPVLVADTASKGHRAAFQIGAQLHYYVSGTFELGGIHVGGEVQYVHVADDTTRLATSAIWPGLTVGPVLGFKITTGGGFTFDSQLGIGIIAARTGGARPNDDEQRVTLLGNLGVGWSF